jgi:hypothetical protein
MLGVLAAAKIDGLRFGRIVLYRLNIGAMMTAIAKRLVRAMAAGAPVITLARLHLYGIRTLLRNLRIRHEAFSFQNA